MTTKALLHELVDEIPDELTDKAWEALRLVYASAKRERAGFIGMVSIDKPHLGRQAKTIVRQEMGTEA